jgi:Fur family ferric uptake transcriptional regulator
LTEEGKNYILIESDNHYQLYVMDNRFSYKRIKNCLQQQGYRLTLARSAVLKVLGNTAQHLSAEEVYRRVSKVYTNIGLATVYRTLELLNQLGIILKFDFGERCARYELITDAQGENHHHHLVCTQCRRIIDYDHFIDQEKELMRKTQASLSKKYNFKIKKHTVHFYGLCSKCQK